MSDFPVTPPKIVVSTTPTKRSWKKRVFLAGLSLVLLLVAFIAWQSVRLTGRVFVGSGSGYLEQIKSVIASATGQVTLEGERDGQINVLLLGIGGEGHDGPYLTDTIIVAQIRPRDQQVSLVSLPRDYLANLGPYGLRKINAAFAEEFSATRDWDKAGKLAREKVGEISGLQIPYFAVVDFSGFEKAIDAVGGVTVTVDRSFTDPLFPDGRLGYLPTVSFQKGTETMDGKRALIFARSRHGTNGEGSDFARSQRQQKVIAAFKDKAVSSSLLASPGALNRLLDVFGQNFHTNLNAGQLWRLYTLTRELPNSSLSALPLDESTGIICPDIVEETGAYVLVPCLGKTKQDVTDFFRNSFLLGGLRQEKARVWLASREPLSSASQKVETSLSALGLTVLPVEYDSVLPEKSIVFQVNPKPVSASAIKQFLSATEASIPPPDLALSPDKLDIVVILGQSD